MFEVKCLSNTIFQKLVLPHLIPKSILTTYTVLTIKGALAFRISPQIRGPIHTIGVKAHDIKHHICLLDPSLQGNNSQPIHLRLPISKIHCDISDSLFRRPIPATQRVHISERIKAYEEISGVGVA
jgi:hypothetical protein